MFNDYNVQKIHLIQLFRSIWFGDSSKCSYYNISVLDSNKFEVQYYSTDI